MIGNEEHAEWRKHWVGIFLAVICALAFPPLVNIIAVPFLLRRDRKSAFCFLIVSIAAISAFYIPIGDQNDYFNLLLEWSDPSYLFDDFVDGATLRELNLVHIALYLFAKIGGSLELFRVILIAIASMFCINVAQNMAYKENNRGDNLMSDVVFILIFMSFPLFSVCTGFRYGLSSIIFVWGILHYEKDGDFKCLVLSALMSSSIHFSIVLFWMFYGVARIPFIVRFIQTRRHFMMIMIIGFLLNYTMTNLFDIIASTLILRGGFIAQKVSIYLSSDAYYNAEYFEVITAKTRLFYSLFAASLFGQLPFLWLSWEHVSRNLKRVLCLQAAFICFGALMYSNITMLNRIVILSLPLFAILVADAISQKKHRNMFMNISFVLFCMFVGLFPIVRMKKAWIRSNVNECICKPSIMCLMNHYDEDWVMDNIEDRVLIE